MILFIAYPEDVIKRSGYDRIPTSFPFRFLVGRDRKLFTAHSALIAHHSDTIDTLVNGHMIEAGEGLAKLGDIHEQTLMPFSQDACTGDYDAVNPDVPPDSFAISTTHTTTRLPWIRSMRIVPY